MRGEDIILYTPTTWPGGSHFVRQYKGAIQKVRRVQLTSFHLCSGNLFPEPVVDDIKSITSCPRGIKVQNKGQCAKLPLLCAALVWARGKSRLEVQAEVVAWGKLWDKGAECCNRPSQR